MSPCMRRGFSSAAGGVSKLEAACGFSGVFGGFIVADESSEAVPETCFGAGALYTRGGSLKKQKTKVPWAGVRQGR